MNRDITRDLCILKKLKSMLFVSVERELSTSVFHLDWDPLQSVLVQSGGLLVSHRNYISSPGNDIVLITPLSGLSAKKVKPKSITFDKQCLVWLPYLSLCRALLRTAWGEGKKKTQWAQQLQVARKKKGVNTVLWWSIYCHRVGRTLTYCLRNSQKKMWHFAKSSQLNVAKVPEAPTHQ